MASWVYLGALKGEQRKFDDDYFYLAINGTCRDTGNQAMIAKGNIIEGIEAKE